MRGQAGGSHRAVAKAARAGRITLVNGKVDVARADAEWIANTGGIQDDIVLTNGAGAALMEARVRIATAEAELRRWTSRLNAESCTEAQSARSVEAMSGQRSETEIFPR